jgi:uncharacterized SAM-binding protein YcdF (DUF218 family)
MFKIRKPIFLILLSFFTTLLIIVLGTAASICDYGSHPTSKSADAAIVLGAEVWKQEPSPVFRERINHAINLSQQGNIRWIIFTGGVGAGKEIAESLAGKNYAIASGVDPKHILTETRSRTTQQNLIHAQNVAKNHQISSFLIVSDPLHLKRAILMAQKLGLKAYPAPTPTTRYRSFDSQFSFLVRETYFYFVYLVWGI